MNKRTDDALILLISAIYAGTVDGGLLMKKCGMYRICGKALGIELCH